MIMHISRNAIAFIVGTAALLGASVSFGINLVEHRSNLFSTLMIVAGLISFALTAPMVLVPEPNRRRRPTRTHDREETRVIRRASRQHDIVVMVTPSDAPHVRTRNLESTMIGGIRREEGVR